MKEIVLKCVSVICITVFSCLLLYFEHPCLAVFLEILGLTIIFDVLVPVIEAINELLF